MDPPEMDEQEMDPTDRVIPYLLINRPLAPPGQFEIISLATNAWRQVTIPLPNDYNFLSSNGSWGMMAKFEHEEDRFLVLLFSLEWQQGLSVPVYVTVGEERLHPRSDHCIGTFSGQSGCLDGLHHYQIYILEPPDMIVGGGGTIWVSNFRNILGHGEVLDKDCCHMIDLDVLFAFGAPIEEITWECHHLNGNFNNAYGLIYRSRTLYWITSLGVDSFDLHSREHVHYALHPNLHFLNDNHGLGPRIYLASRDSDIFYISLANQQVQIGKLVNDRVELFHGRIEDGAVLVNRGQAGIWIEDLTLLPDLHNMEDTVSEGPPVPCDLGTYYFRSNIWHERRICNLLNCQGVWLLSADDRLRELGELDELDLHIYNVPGIGELPPAAEAEEEEEEEEDEEEDGAVTDQGTLRIVDGFQKCERWVQGGGADDSDESKTTSWLSRLMYSLASRRWRPAKLLLIAVVLYLVFTSFKLFRFFSQDEASPHSVHSRLIQYDQSDQTLNVELDQNLHLSEKDPLIIQDPTRRSDGYERITGEILRRYARAPSRSRSWTRTGKFSELERVAQEAWALGHKAWDEAVNYRNNGESGSVADPPEKMEPCPTSVGSNKGGDAGKDGGRVVLLPCGLAVGSSITIIGTLHDAHEDFVPQLAKIRDGNGTVMVSQFIMEFQGLKAVDGEEPSKILHLNPRLKGDWSEKPILEHNTCYRMSWGKAMCCDGLSSRDTDETGDGFQKCERWVQGGGTDDSDELKTTSWLKRFIGRAKKPKMTWPFSFSEGRMFVLTIQAGVESYHINIGGRHISSFPYQTGFTLEDATGLVIKGDIDVHSVFATSLPQTHPSFSHQQVLEMTDKWRARPLLKGPTQLFIGILSATNHFAERMAIRKTWMQYPAIQLGHAVARFCVALSPRKGVNAATKKVAEYFGDIVILPFLDRYDLVVLKTFTICEYGVQNITSDYMKCDDDTFVWVDVVLKEISTMGQKKPIYMGNLNLLHRPLRSGKWAVTYEECPEELHPPYANGPGHIISFDIAKYIVSQQTDNKLRLFKMEDESMRMWVEKFNSNWFQSSTCTAGNLVNTVVSKTTTK